MNTNKKSRLLMLKNWHRLNLIVITITFHVLNIIPVFSQKDSCLTDPDPQKNSGYVHTINAGIHTYLHKINSSTNEYQQTKKMLIMPDVEFKAKWIRSDHLLPNTIATGLWINSSISEYQSLGNTKHFWGQTFFNLPVMIGLRIPINHNDKLRRYNAIDLECGMYIGSPFIEILENRNTSKSSMDYVFGKTIKNGFVATITYSSLNEKGYGLSFGLRVTSDLGYLRKNNPYELYPIYSSVGIFVNLISFYD